MTPRGSTAPYWSGELVRLRHINSDDYDAVMAAREDQTLQRMADEIRLPPHPTALTERLAKKPDETAHAFWLAIEDLATGQLAGWLTTHGCDRRHRNFEYGIAIFAEHRKQGFAREALSLLLRYFFEELGYNRVTATVYDFNQPSIQFHENFGFSKEGILRKNLFTGGAFHDEIIYGLLADEFNAMS